MYICNILYGLYKIIMYSIILYFSTKVGIARMRFIYLNSNIYTVKNVYTLISILCSGYT